MINTWIWVVCLATQFVFVCYFFWQHQQYKKRFLRVQEKLNDVGTLRYGEGFTVGFNDGMKEMRDSLEKVSVERGVDYRTAAHIIQRICPACKRKCIHCAREEAQMQEKLGQGCFAHPGGDPSCSTCEVSSALQNLRETVGISSCPAKDELGPDAACPACD